MTFTVKGIEREQILKSKPIKRRYIFLKLNYFFEILNHKK